MEKEIRQNSTNNTDNEISSQEIIEDARARRQNKNGRFSFNNCEFSTTSVTLLKKHNVNVHDSNEENDPNKNIQERHIRKSNKCNEYDFTSTSEENLKKHIRTVHKLKCEKCDSEFATKDNLKKHMQAAHKQKRIECKQCAKRFNKEETFRNHMNKIHSQIKKTLSKPSQ